jgi:single-strand DNA-binding protein
MASINKVILIGNVGHNPEARYTYSGQMFTRFKIATTEKFKNQDGERKEYTNWHTIIVFGKRAEVIQKYLTKGRSVYVEGSIRNRKYDDKNGNERYITEIMARNIEFLDYKIDNSNKTESNIMDD